MKFGIDCAGIKRIAKELKIGQVDVPDFVKRDDDSGIYRLYYDYDADTDKAKVGHVSAMLVNNAGDADVPRIMEILEGVEDRKLTLVGYASYSEGLLLLIGGNVGNQSDYLSTEISGLDEADFETWMDLFFEATKIAHFINESEASALGDITEDIIYLDVPDFIESQDDTEFYG